MHKFITVLILFLLSENIHAQENNSPVLSGNAEVTQNGISLIPSFSLEEPAVLFNLKSDWGKISFEPEFRFALEGKPWSFTFWWRYQMVQNEKFRFRVGIQPALNFRTIEINRRGRDEEILESRRFLATEFVPSFKITNNYSVGAYYFVGRGFDDSAKWTNFIVLNNVISNVELVNDIHLLWIPGVYYLKMDELDGTYATSTLRLSKSGSGLGLQSVMSKIIDSQIAPDKDLVWNISLLYQF